MPIVYDFPSETPLAFDTDVFTHLRNQQSSILAKVKTYFSNTKQFPALPAITVFEAFQGIEQQLSKRKISIDDAEVYKQRVKSLTEMHQILTFNEKAAEIASYVCSRIGKSKSNEHWYDIFIIATVLANNFGLITQNKKDAELIANHLPNNIDLRLSIWKL